MALIPLMKTIVLCLLLCSTVFAQSPPNEAKEKRQIVDTLKLAGRTVDPAKYTLPQLQKMLRYLEMTPAQIASEQAQERMNEINEREQRAWEARSAPLAKAKGMTLAEYARWEMEENQRKEIARIKAKEQSEQARLIEFYKLWLQERQTRALEQGLNNPPPPTGGLSDYQFLQWLDSMTTAPLKQ